MEQQQNYGISPAFRENLTPQQQEFVMQTVRKTNINDVLDITSFCSEQEGAVNGFNSTMLDGQTAASLGEAGDLITSCMTKIKGFDVEECKPGLFGFGSKMIKKGSNKFNRLRARYQTVDAQLEELVQAITAKEMDVQQVANQMDQMIESNRKEREYMKLMIVAGMQILEEKRQELEALKADPTADPVQVKQFSANIDRFDRRLYNLALTKELSDTLGPKMLDIKTSAQNTQDALVTVRTVTIKTWKSQLSMIFAAEVVKKGVELTNQITDFNNQLALKVSESVKDLSIEAAKAQERGVIDMDVLRQINQNALETAAQTEKIALEAKKKREADRAELAQMSKAREEATRRIA
ncbi:MAG: toxic anion resistance protein [Clostridia bacterium]|nr:toxic anion resistance protein [Clostridia bacterium]